MTERRCHDDYLQHAAANSLADDAELDLIDARAELRALAAENARLRELVCCLVENDPNECVADGGHTVLDVWRRDARAALTTPESAPGTGDGER